MCWSKDVERDTFIGTWEGDGWFGEFELAIKEGGERLEGHYTTNPNPDRLPYRAQRRGLSKQTGVPGYTEVG